MSIDARIKAVKQVGSDLVLELEPRTDQRGAVSLAGQDALTILDFKFKPEVGDEIWGGSSTAQIVRKNGRSPLHYRREGYTKLREDHDAPMKPPQSMRIG